MEAIELKEGNFTKYNNHEYKVGTSYDPDKRRNNVLIYTRNKNDIDESFLYDKTLKRYYKIVDPSSLDDVFEYSVEYYYKGHKVEKCVGKQGEVSIFVGEWQKEFALSNGFEEFDRGEYIKKNVPESEIEAKQIGPVLNGRFKFY